MRLSMFVFYLSLTLCCVHVGGLFWLWPNVKGQNMPLWPASLVDEWIADCRHGWIHGSYGYAESQLAYQALQQMSLGGKHIVVFGSERPWLEACALAAGASKVTTIEYSNVTTDHPAIQVITPQEAARRWVHGTLPSFDAVATFSSLEHAGLGRYGDQLNPWGDIMAVGQAWCISKPGFIHTNTHTNTTHTHTQHEADLRVAPAH